MREDTQKLEDPNIMDLDIKGPYVLLKPLQFPAHDDLGLPVPGIGLALKVGEHAFDEKAFPNGCKCSEGDMVQFELNTNQQNVIIAGVHYILVMDLDILCVYTGYFKEKLLEKFDGVKNAE